MRLYLTVNYDKVAGPGGDLWYKDMPDVGVPNMDTRWEIGGTTCYPKHIYISEIGIVTVDLRTMHVDPDPSKERYLSMADAMVNNTIWWSSTSPPIELWLEESGFNPYVLDDNDIRPSEFAVMIEGHIIGNLTLDDNALEHILEHLNAGDRMHIIPGYTEHGGGGVNIHTWSVTEG